SAHTIEPVVAGSQSDSSAQTVRATGVGSSMFQPSGARPFQAFSKAAKPGMDLAAKVRTGPAVTRLTRTPCGPRSRARERHTDSSPDFAPPLPSQPRHARRLLK